LRAEAGEIQMAFLKYGYTEAVELCKDKYNDSSSVIAKSYEEWLKNNKTEIDAAFKQLEQEAAVDPVKAKKLPTLESYVRGLFKKEFLDMSAEETAPICLTEKGYLEKYDLERISKH
jgi:hypothetical protein